MKKTIVAICMTIASSNLWAGESKIIYLGGGRSTCNGSDCERYNARQTERNHQDNKRWLERKEYENERLRQKGEDMNYETNESFK